MMKKCKLCVHSKVFISERGMIKVSKINKCNKKECMFVFDTYKPGKDF